MQCIGLSNNILHQGMLKLLPYHDQLKARGACFGQSAAYERPMWYALNGKETNYKYSYGYKTGMSLLNLKL